LECCFLISMLYYLVIYVLLIENPFQFQALSVDETPPFCFLHFGCSSSSDSASLLEEPLEMLSVIIELEHPLTLCTFLLFFALFCFLCFLSRRPGRRYS
jgi:hypothetical protein